jgi:rubrerythrin
MAPVSQTVLDGLNTGIQAELAAYVFYRKAMTFLRDESLIELLGSLAAEEKDHYRVLEKTYDNLVRSEMWVAYNDIMLKPGLPDLDEKMEEVHTDFIDEIGEETIPMRVLEIALSLEQRARDLYAGLADRVDDPKGKEMFTFLSNFEKGHAIRIQKMMANLG